jgi:hypothetical protein
MVAESRCTGGPARRLAGRVLRGVAAGLVAASAALASAAEGDLFHVAVPVADQGAATRAAGERTGLARVLERVAGAPDVLDRPEVRAALDDPRRYYRSAGYARRPERSPGEGDDAGPAREPWLLQLEFDRQSVLDLLAAADVPVWTGDRPELLLWIAVEDADGRRALVGADHPWAAPLADAARRLGLPVTLPLVDLTDLARLGARDVWARFREPVEAASERYDAEAVLLVRLREAPVAGWRLDWTGEVAGVAFDEGLEAPSPEAGLEALLETVLDDLLARYAIRVGEAASVLWLQVDGIDDYPRYAALVRYLDGLTGVKESQVVQVQERSLLLRVTSADTVERLLDLLRLEQRLETAPEPERAGDVRIWRGRWRG